MGFVINGKSTEKSDEKWKCSKEEIYSFLHSREQLRYIGLDREIDIPDVQPEWYDEELFKRGQRFSQNYFLSASIAQLIGLVSLLSFESSIKPLIFTRKSDSLDTAKERYLSTTLTVKSWYESDLWDKNSEGNKNLRKVRNYHLSVSNKVNSLTDEEIQEQCTLSSVIGRENTMCPLYGKVAEDLKDLGGEEVKKFTDRTVYFNQAEMSFTLFGFMGLLLVCPEKFGVPDNEEDLPGFVHLWRVIGYMLGVQDEYNICNGSFDEVKEVCIKLFKYVFRPNIENINHEWEHMSRCAVDGLKMVLDGPSFEGIFLCLLWVFDLDLTNLLNNVSWLSRIQFYAYKFVVTYMYKFDFIKRAIHLKINNSLRRAAKERSINL